MIDIALVIKFIGVLLMYDKCVMKGAWRKAPPPQSLSLMTSRRSVTRRLYLFPRVPGNTLDIDAARHFGPGISDAAFREKRRYAAV